MQQSLKFSFDVKATVFLSLILFFISQSICFASSEKKDHAEANAHSEKTIEKADAHGAPAKEAPAKEAHGEAEAPPAPKGPSRKYNPGSVEPFPTIAETLNVLSGNKFSYAASRGRVALLFFIASWCEPCQLLLPDFKVIAAKYQRLYTDPVFIFAHDTNKDAAAFAKEYKLSGNVVLSNHEILKSFRNPSLPAVYVSDRYQYMGFRSIKMSKNNLQDLENYLQAINAF